MRPGTAVWRGWGTGCAYATVDGVHYYEVELPVAPEQWLQLQLDERDEPLATMRGYLERMGAEFTDVPLSVLACAMCGESGADTEYEGEPVHGRCAYPSPDPDPDPTWGHGAGVGPVRC